MASRTVTGFVQRNLTPIVGAKVRFKLNKPFGYTATTIYVDGITEATTDATGNFSIALWCDEESSKAVDYIVNFPVESSGAANAQHVAKFSLPVGDLSSKSIGDLINEYLPTSGQSTRSIEVLIDQHIGLANLDNLADVVIVSPTNGQTIVYDTTLGRWKNAAGAVGSTVATVAEVNAGVDNTKIPTALALEGSKYLTQSGTKVSATASGTNTYTATITPAITAYVTGQRFFITFTIGNTGAATINLNALGAIAIKKNGTAALVSGDIPATAVGLLAYDGTNFQLLNPAVSAGGGTVTSVTSANGDATVVPTTTAPVITIVSAPKLTTARAINGTNFDGTAAITVTAAAGTLTGATLAAGVTASSLTSFGASPTLVTPLLGTPTSGVATNLTGTASGLTAGTVTTIPNLTGNVTSSGNVTTIPAATVTLAMQANVATASVFYRKTAGAGAPEVNTLATLKTDLNLTGTNSGDQTIKFYENLLRGNVNPDTSGKVFSEPYTIKATNDVFQHNVWVFNEPTADEKLYGTFELPVASASAPTFKLVWTSTIITATVVQWSIGYRVITGTNTNSLDQAGALTETLTAGPSAPGAADRRIETSFSATNTNFTTAGTVEWILTRVDTGDTLIGAVSVHGFRFECVI